MKCYCNDYAKNIRLVDLAMVKGGGYQGKFFKYCPWCGFEIDRVPVKAEEGGNMSVVLNRKHF